MFRRILVAVDQGGAGQAALDVALELVDRFGAAAWVHDVAPGARPAQVVVAIGAEARCIGADLVVLGLDRARLTRRHRGGTVAEQVGRTTALPVMVPTTGPTAVVPDAQRGQEGLTRV